MYLSLHSCCELQGQDFVFAIWSSGVHLLMRSNLLGHVLSSKSVFYKIWHFSPEKIYMIWKCLLSTIMPCSYSWSMQVTHGSVQAESRNGRSRKGTLPCSLVSPSHLPLTFFLSSTTAITHSQHYVPSSSSTSQTMEDIRQNPFNFLLTLQPYSFPLLYNLKFAHLASSSLLPTPPAFSGTTLESIFIF